MSEPNVGNVSYFKVFSGTLNAGDDLTNAQNTTVASGRSRFARRSEIWSGLSDFEPEGTLSRPRSLDPRRQLHQLRQHIPKRGSRSRFTEIEIESFVESEKFVVGCLSLGLGFVHRIRGTNLFLSLVDSLESPGGQEGENCRANAGACRHTSTCAKTIALRTQTAGRCLQTGAQACSCACTNANAFWRLRPGR